VLIDTRKTTPGLRALEKHAAQLGGRATTGCAWMTACSLRTHISVCGRSPLPFGAPLGSSVLTKIEVECDTLEQAKEALQAGADMILLDNMSLEDLRRAVALAAAGFRSRPPAGEAGDHPRHRRDRRRFHLGGPHHAVRACVDIGLDAVLRV